MLRLFQAVTSLNKSLLLQNINYIATQRCFSLNATPTKLISCQLSVPLYQPQRNTNFFNKLPADALWKGVISVSNAGKKRGRGKGIGRKTAKNLNRGQVIGIGQKNMVWPGLNAPILRGKELVTQEQLPEDTMRQEKLIKMRDQQNFFRRERLSPLDRGWSGNKLPGRSIGPPDPIGEEKFEGFDTKVLEFKNVFTMKGNFGRKRKMSVMVVTGNGKGLIGFALGKGIEPRAAMRKAKNRAAQRLMHFPLYKNHTVFHDFACQFGQTKLFVNKKQEGYGLKCHRAVREICQILGIKDIHVKLEGSNNLQHIVKAFFVGLLQQKPHEQLAEEKQLHLVEYREEEGSFPKVAASPSYCRKEEELKPNEILDFNQYVMNDKVVLKKKKLRPFYEKFPSWEIKCKKIEKNRGHNDVRIQLRAQYGNVRSFLHEKYPECQCNDPERIEKD